MAWANGRPPPRPARALGTTATTEACTPLGNRGRSADRSRCRLSRPVRPGQPSAHHRRARRNDPRHSAAGSLGDPYLCPGGRARSNRRAFGAARPRPLPSPFRRGTRRHHPRPRHRRGGRHNRGRRGEAGGRPSGRRAPQPVRPPDSRVHGSDATPGAHPAPDPNTRCSSHGVLRASANSPQASLTQPSSRFGRPSNPASRPSSKTAIGPSSPSVSRGKSTPRGGHWDRVSTSPRLLCSGTSESTPPRSIRARTSWPTRPSPPTSSSFWTSGRGSNSPSRTSSGSTARESSAPGEKSAAYRPRSSRSMVSGATAGRRSRAAGSSSRASLSPASRSPPPASSPPRLASRSRRSERAHPSPRRSPSRPPLARFWRSPSSP